jgi:hypothetical protein
MVMLSGCGSESGSAGGSAEQSPQAVVPAKGVFVDSPVAGMSYQTATQSGVTDEKGEFKFLPGETVTFSIGDVIIGSAPGAAQVTPVDLGIVKIDSDQRTVNISRFLQALDRDGNHDNGIQLSQEINAELKGRTIDFNKDSADFDDADMQALFASLNRKGTFTGATQRGLASDLTALYKLRKSLHPENNPFDGEWFAPVSYLVAPGTGGSGTITIGSGRDIPPPPPPVQVLMLNGASITIAGSNVSFVPVPGVLVNGTIDSSGVITIPDWTTGCKAYDGKPQTMTSKLTLNLNGSIHGEWSIVDPGYCSPRLINTNFPPPLRIPFLDLTLIGVRLP